MLYVTSKKVMSKQVNEILHKWARLDNKEENKKNCFRNYRQQTTLPTVLIRNRKCFCKMKCVFSNRLFHPRQLRSSKGQKSHQTNRSSRNFLDSNFNFLRFFLSFRYFDWIINSVSQLVFSAKAVNKLRGSCDAISFSFKLYFLELLILKFRLTL